MYVDLRREYERPNHQLIRAREAHFFIMDIVDSTDSLEVVELRAKTFIIF